MQQVTERETITSDDDTAFGLQHQDEFIAYRMLLQAYDASRDGRKGGSSGGGDDEGAGLEKVLIASIILRRNRIPKLRTIKQCHTAGRIVSSLAREGEKALASAMEVVLALALGNYARIFAILREEDTDILIRCLIFNLLSIIRRKILMLYHQSFGPQTIALEHLGNMLCISEPEHLLDFCGRHNLVISGQEGQVITGGDLNKKGICIDTIKVNLKKSQIKVSAGPPILTREDGLVLGFGAGRDSSLTQLWTTLCT